MAKMGRPPIYSDEVAEAIAERLATGESLASICEDKAMPSLRTAIRWSKEHETFGTVYAHAREAQAEEMDRKILDAASEATAENAAAARVKIDAYKWRAARLNPQRYGDKIDVTTGGEKVTMDETAVAVRAAALLKMGLDRAGSD